MTAVLVCFTCVAVAADSAESETYPQSTAAKLEAQLESVPLDQHGARAEILMRLAVVRSATGKPERARAAAEAAVREADEHGDAERSQRARLVLTTTYSLGEESSAAEAHLLAELVNDAREHSPIAHSRRLRKVERVVAYYRLHKRYADAVKLLEGELQSEGEDDCAGHCDIVGHYYEIAARVNRDRGDLESAIRSYQKTLAAHSHLPHVSSTQAVSQLAIASAYHELGRVEEADAAYTETTQLFERMAASPQNSIDLAAILPEVLEPHARLLMAAGMSQRARELLKKAEKLRSQWDSRDPITD